MRKRICIVTPRYPTSADETALTFVQQLAWSMADLGNEVSVVCPLPVNLNDKFKKVPDYIEEKTYKDNMVRVYCPKVIGFGQQSIWKFNTARFTAFFFERAVKKVLTDMEEKPQILYGHFVAPSGVVACELGKKYGIPAFIAYGESTTWSIDHAGRKYAKKAVENVAGVISVSTKNTDDLVETGIVEPSKIKVFPNGYNPGRFSPKDRAESRQHFGFSQDDFIVAFVGHFIKRKGIGVLCEAIEAVSGVKLACAGRGEMTPIGDQVIYASTVSPENLSEFYSAADVFVLPTLNEGCCNAIVEAMACGLPIISSDRAFNYDILDDSNAILIDPTDVKSISDAIVCLRDDKEKREKMGQASLRKAAELTIERRAANILAFIESKSKK